MCVDNTNSDIYELSIQVMQCRSYNLDSERENNVITKLTKKHA